MNSDIVNVTVQRRSEQEVEQEVLTQIDNEEYAVVQEPDSTTSDSEEVVAVQSSDVSNVIEGESVMMNHVVSHVSGASTQPTTTNAVRSSGDMLSPEKRSIDQQASVATLDNNKEIFKAAESAGPVSVPLFEDCMKDSGIYAINILGFRVAVLIDLNQTPNDLLMTYSDEQGLINETTAREIMSKFTGRKETVNLFNPFRRKKLDKKGAMLRPGGFMREEIPSLIIDLASNMSDRIFVYSPDANFKQALSSYSHKVTEFINKRIDAVVNLNADIFSTDDGDVLRVCNLVTPSVWLNQVSDSDSESEDDGSAYILTIGLRLIIPELLFKKDEDSIMKFIDNINEALENSFIESDIEELGIGVDLVLGVITNTTLMVTNPAVSEFTSSLLYMSMHESEEDTYDWTSFSGYAVRSSLKKLEPNSVFPTTVESFNEIFGSRTDLIFMTFLQYESEEEDEDEDYDDDEDEDSSDGAEAEVVPTKSVSSSKELKQLRKDRKQAKSSEDESSDSIVERLASGDSDNSDIEKLIKAIEREVGEGEHLDEDDEDDEDENDFEDQDEGEYEESEDSDDDEVDEDEEDQSEEEEEVEDRPKRVQRTLATQPGVSTSRRNIPNPRSNR